MNKQEATELCGFILALWPNFAVTEKTSLVYAEMLKDVSLRDAMKAIRLIANTDQSQFAPPIAKIREAIRKLKRRNEKTVEEKFAALIRLAEKYGVDEWEEVQKRMYPETLRAVKALSWRRFCFETVESLPFLLRDFKAVYESVQESVIFEETASKISGLPEPVRKLLNGEADESKSKQAVATR